MNTPESRDPATLPELAEHGVHAVALDLAAAVAEHGPFPMPTGVPDPTPLPGELAQQSDGAL